MLLSTNNESKCGNPSTREFQFPDIEIIKPPNKIVNGDLVVLVKTE